MTSAPPMEDEILVSDEDRGQITAGSSRVAVLGSCPPSLLALLSHEYECVPLETETGHDFALSVLATADLLVVFPAGNSPPEPLDAHALIEAAHFQFRLPVVEVDAPLPHVYSFASTSADPMGMKALCQRLLYVSSSRSHQGAFAALHLSNEAILIVDARTKEITFSNAAANALLNPHTPHGAPSPQVEGSHFHHLFLGGSLMGTLDEGEGALASNTALQVAWKRLGVVKDGLITLHCSDATERRALREALEHERALTINASRVAALGEFAACLAHEVNNPLALVLGRCSQLQHLLEKEQTVEPKEVSVLVERIVFAAKRIARIVKATSNLSRMSSSSEAPHRVSVKFVFEAVDELVRFQQGTSDIQFHCSCETLGDLHVMGHESELIQVLFNLVANALDAVHARQQRELAAGLPRHQGWVRLQAEEIEKEGGIVRLSVADSGDGVLEELSEKIWKPFFTTKEPGKGTGLGLHVCRSLVENVGGRAYHTRLCSPDGSFSTVFIIELKSATFLSSSEHSAA